MLQVHKVSRKTDCRSKGRSAALLANQLMSIDDATDQASALTYIVQTSFLAHPALTQV